VIETPEERSHDVSNTASYVNGRSFLSDTESTCDSERLLEKGAKKSEVVPEESRPNIGTHESQTLDRKSPSSKISIDDETSQDAFDLGDSTSSSVRSETSD